MITYIARYEVLVTVNNVDKAIIHNTEILYGMKSSLRRTQTINAKVIGGNKGILAISKGRKVTTC